MKILKVCKECGKEYVTSRITSIYCSSVCCHRVAHRNEKKRLKAKREEQKKLKSASEPILTIQEPPKEFLTPGDVAKLLGVSLPTVYRYFALNIIKAVKIRRNTFIRREDLNAMFETATYKKRAYHRKATDEVAYYSMRDIMDKYKIGKKAILSRCDRFGIPKIYEGRNFYYNKKSVDEHFAELLEDIDLSDYYTVDQLMEKLNMKRGNVLTFVARNKIPRVTRGRDVYYSKIHIDSFKRKGDELDDNWYTYPEISEKHGLSKDRISYYLKNYKIRTEKRGKYTMIYRSDFDNIVINGLLADVARDKDTGKLAISSKQKITPHKEMTPPETPEGYYSADDISKKYKVLLKRVYQLAKENRIPKISLHHYNFYEKTAVDVAFNQPVIVDGVKEWITIEEVEKLYGVKDNARRSFMYRHKIPTKIEFGKQYYSKTHIDRIKKNQFEGYENYYSTQEAMEKFNLTKDLVFYYAKHYNVSKVNYGKNVFLSKAEFDELMKKRFAKENNDLITLEKLNNKG